MAFRTIVPALLLTLTGLAGCTCNGNGDDSDGGTGFRDTSPPAPSCSVHVPGDHQRIQDALDTTTDGDTICVHAGTYTELIDFRGKQVNVVGLDGAEETVIDGLGQGPVVAFSNNEGRQTRLSGFTITGGFGAQGACVRISDASPTLENLIITGCRTTNGGSWEDGGAGIYVCGQGASPMIVDTEVSNCHAEIGWGGGVAVFGGQASLENVRVAGCSTTNGHNGGGVSIKDSVVTMEHVTLENNATDGSSSGGGLAVGSSQVTIADLWLEGNTAGSGGGMYFSQSTGIVERVELIENTADHLGGGAALTGSPLAIRDWTVRGNEQWTSDGGGGMAISSSDADMDGVRILENRSYSGMGAGILIINSSPTISNTAIHGNESYLSNEACGGGVALRASSPIMEDVTIDSNSSAKGGGVCVEAESELLLTRALVSGNTATNGMGGGILAYGGTKVTVQNASIAGNASQSHDSSWGAGVSVWAWSDAAELSLNYVVIAGNTNDSGAGNRGAGLDLYGAVVAEVRNGSIVSNTGGVGVNLDARSELQVAWSNIHGNDAGDWGGMEDPTGTSGNISSDPRTLDTNSADPLAWDLHLDTTSPQIDAGDPSNIDPDGSRADIGAWGGPDASHWDLDGDGFPSWWSPGSYDFDLYPQAGWDCDDLDATVFPGEGC